MSEERQIGAPDGNLVLDLFVLHQRVGELMEGALAGTGVRPAEYAVYSTLRQDALTPRELTARLGVTPSTLTGHLAALERRGHLRRTPNPRDARSHLVELTAEGRRAWQECRAGFRAMLAAFEADLQTEAGLDLGQVRALLLDLDVAAARVAGRLG